MLTCRTAPIADAGWPVGSGSGVWTPELPHQSDPWPGDPVITPAWLEDERVDVDGAGIGWVGAVLSRRVMPHEFDGLVLVPGTVAPEHFPALAGRELPIPGRLRARRRWTGYDVADSFGLTASDTAPLIDELLASGAMRTSDEATA